MSVLNKIKLIYRNFLMATANVEQNALNDYGDNNISDGGINKIQEKTHSMSSALLNGVVNEEVKLLRARYYKVLDKMESTSIKAKNQNIINKAEFTINENGFANYDSVNQTGSDKYEYEVIDKYNYLQLKKVLTDEYDTEYPLEMVIKNTLIYSIDETKLDTTDYKFIFDYGEIASKYQLRRFSELVKIKMIDNDTSLLEFYVPFEDFENETNKPYIALKNDINKCKNKKDFERLFMFGEFGFHTDEKDLGVKSMRDFVYNEPEFIRLVEYNQNYVVKFKVKNLLKNFFVGGNYSMDELDKLYDEKAIRKN